MPINNGSQIYKAFRNLLREDKSKNTFLVDEARQEVLVLMKNNLKEIDIQYTPLHVSSVVGYKNELIQVFIILLSNAIDALNENKVSDKMITIHIVDREQYIHINIEDNADGVDKNIIAKIFDPYFTTKQKSSGSGLGLYIAKIIIEQNMQGKLSVHKETTGAKFDIKIKKKL